MSLFIFFDSVSLRLPVEKIVFVKSFFVLNYKQCRSNTAYFSKIYFHKPFHIPVLNDSSFTVAC